MMKEVLTTALTVVVWTLEWPAQFWVYSSKWVDNSATAKATVYHDWCLAMFLIVFLFLVEAVVEYPLALFSQFSIEDQHGFNKQTLGGWFKDQIKVLGLQVVLVPGLVYFLLWIISSTGEYFYLYAGSFLTVIILFFVVAAPLCIMPMFYKFDKLEENSLKADIEKLAEDVKYPLSAIEVIDGSTRSGHSNAFQYGFGKIKKIVLFDTLLEQSLGMKDAAADLADVDKMSKVASKTTEEQEEIEQKKPQENENEAEGSAAEVEGQQDPEEKKVLKQSDFNYNNHKGKMEILAIVAHELGHWAHMDNPKGIALSVFRMYLLFFAFSFALKYTNMPADFGFAEPSTFVSLYLFMMLMTPVLYLLQLLDVLFVRSIEFAADRYSVEQGYAEPLKTALIAIHVENGGSLCPDWLYSALKYDHPPLIERNAAVDAYVCKMMEIENLEEAQRAYQGKFSATLSSRHAINLASLGETQKEGGQAEKMQPLQAKHSSPQPQQAMRLDKGQEK